MEFNTGLKIYKSGSILLPAEITRALMSILEAMQNKNLEYGIYLKGKLDVNNLSVIIDSSEYYIPKQKVTAATIEFLEEPPSFDWNVVVHRHPHSCRVFSGVDDNSINTEFLASILFIPPWEYPQAIINVPLIAGTKLQIPASVTVTDYVFQETGSLLETVNSAIAPLITKPKKINSNYLQGLARQEYNLELENLSDDVLTDNVYYNRDFTLDGIKI
jgi:hypothetical protein